MKKLRLKVLVSAYACEPCKGSEPAVGWNFVLNLSSNHDLWVLTRSNNRESIEDELKKNNISNLHFIYYDLPKWFSWWKRGQKGVRLYYHLWQLGAQKIASKFSSSIKFDLTHHITFAKYWSPSFLPFLDLPYIWGPVGGGDITPVKFLQFYSIRGRILELIRFMAIRFSEYDPMLRLTAARSNLGIASTPATAKRLEKIGCRNIITKSQVILNKEEYKYLSKHNSQFGQPFRFLSVGRLVHWKGYNIGIKAFSMLPRSILYDCEYIIIGQGPEKNNLKKEINRFGLQKNVDIIDPLPRFELWKIFEKFHAFIHPSLHDSGGFVLVEAMAAGLPCIAPNLGGSAIIVDESSGFKIDAIHPSQTIEELSKAMTAILDKDTWYRKSASARLRIKDNFVFESQNIFYDRLYRLVANESPSSS